MLDHPLNRHALAAMAAALLTLVGFQQVLTVPQQVDGLHLAQIS